MAVLRRRDTAQVVARVARGRWDAALGLLLSAASLAVLREAEAVEQDGLRRLDEAASAAEQLLAGASQHADAAAAAAMVQATLGVRREQLANRCAARLRRGLLRVEEAASEDDLAGRGVGGP